MFILFHTQQLSRSEGNQRMRMEPFLNKIERKTFSNTAKGKQLRYLHFSTYLYLPHVSMPHQTSRDTEDSRGHSLTFCWLMTSASIISAQPPTPQNPRHVLRPRARARQTKQMLLLADFQWEIGPEWIKYSLENIQKMEVTLRRFPFHCFSFNTQAWKVFA